MIHMRYRFLQQPPIVIRPLSRTIFLIISMFSLVLDVLDCPTFLSSSTSSRLSLKRFYCHKYLFFLPKAFNISSLFNFKQNRMQFCCCHVQNLKINEHTTIGPIHHMLVKSKLRIYYG